MLPIEVQIERAQRLVRTWSRMLPGWRFVSLITPEHQQSAKSHAAMITACARAELQRLMEESIPKREGRNCY
jgi:hypothetical protein